MIWFSFEQTALQRSEFRPTGARLSMAAGFAFFVRVHGQRQMTKQSRRKARNFQKTVETKKFPGQIHLLGERWWPTQAETQEYSLSSFSTKIGLLRGRRKRKPKTQQYPSPKEHAGKCCGRRKLSCLYPERSHNANWNNFQFQCQKVLSRQRLL